MLTTDEHASEASRAIAYVIDRTNYIEFTIKGIIVMHINAAPVRSDFVRNILLHSSVVGLGQKVKVLQFIVREQNWPTIDSNHFHNVLSLRNAFAHSDTVTTNIEVTLAADGAVAKTEVFQLLDSINLSGKVKTLTRSEALSEFNRSFEPLRNYLHDLNLNYAGK